MTIITTSGTLYLFVEVVYRFYNSLFPCLFREKRNAWQLHKEKAALKLRLADLQRGQAFLHDIRGIYAQYLDFRHKHPKEEETVHTLCTQADVYIMEILPYKVCVHMRECVRIKGGGQIRVNLSIS